MANSTSTASWDLVISSHRGWFNLNIQELWRYRDLIMLFVRRDLVSQYKQTILGPAYYALTPVLSTIINTLIFGKIAKLSTDGIPHFLFYMSGTLFWGYFSHCLTSSKNTFSANAGIFAQVYFPRLTTPISLAISGLGKLVIQFIVFFSFYAYFVSNGFRFSMSIWVIVFPILLLQCALLGLGVGVFLSSFSTKYRDLNFIYGFLISGWMYASPVVYPLSVIPERYHLIMSINPMVGVIESVRQILFGVSSLSIEYVLIGVAVNFIFLLIGILIFNKVEKTFLDTV